VRRHGWLGSICGTAIAVGAVATAAGAGAGCGAGVTGDDPDASRPDARAPADAADGPDAAPAAPPAVIVMIGDGMGPGQLDVASLYATGATGGLAMHELPHAGWIRTGGPSGITDSAAAASVMATGVYTYNGRVALDRAGAPVETVLERAAARGWATGVVTTTAVSHATPAGFTAHVGARGAYGEIAAQQASTGVADVVLGGGAQHFAGLEPALAAAGYARVTTAAELAAVAPAVTRLFGTFAPEHLTYVADRPVGTTEPTLAQQARAALAVLDRDPDGFFLMIEGGRIDHGGHANVETNVIHETLAFDETIADVVAWARARGNVTVLVTADHECGGLRVLAPAPAGVVPDVSWRWGSHTNAHVAIFGDGPGTEVIDDAVVDHRWVYEVARSRVDGDAFVAPPPVAIPDGETGELRHLAATQVNPSGFGPGFNQLDALRVDATADGLFVGVDGVFEWGANAVEVWIDVDFGAGTGPGGLAGAVTDAAGVADLVLAASTVTAPAVPGFGVDLVLVSVGGADPMLEQRRGSGGLRGLRAPYGAAGDLGWGRAAINFGEVRVAGGAALAARSGHGLEAFVPWDALYDGGVVPPGARVALAAILVNTDGGYTSNQALPPFPPGTVNPGRTPTALPGVVVYDLDADGDGVVDGDAAPVTLP
jgi:alkaline phosphatase